MYNEIFPNEQIETPFKNLVLFFSCSFWLLFQNSIPLFFFLKVRHRLVHMLSAQKTHSTEIQDKKIHILMNFKTTKGT